MGACNCTGACRDGRGCRATGQPVPGVSTSCVVTPPLTVEDVRRVIREEIYEYDAMRRENWLRRAEQHVAQSRGPLND